MQLASNKMPRLLNDFLSLNPSSKRVYEVDGEEPDVETSGETPSNGYSVIMMGFGTLITHSKNDLSSAYKIA